MTNSEIVALILILVALVVLVVFVVIYVCISSKKKTMKAIIKEEEAKLEEIESQPLDETEEVGENEEPLGEYLTPEGITVKKETTESGVGYSFYKVRSDGIVVPLSKLELVEYLNKTNKEVYDRISKKN